LRELTGHQNEVGPDVAKIGSGNAFKQKWIKKEGDNVVLVEKEVEDQARLFLQKVRETKSTPNAKITADLKKRKLVTTGKHFDYVVRKGPKYAPEMKIEATDLTVDMLANDAWEKEEFKPYNFKALGASENTGALHPLNKVRAEFRQIFFNQGFVEMPTNKYAPLSNASISQYLTLLS
jgi:phenylalanyl-tRNA synthetase alpha chain